MTVTLDPQAGVRVYDAGSNKNLTTYGDEDFNQSDHLKVTINGVLRQVMIQAMNDGEDGDDIPLIASAIPDFLGSFVEFDDFEKFDADDDWTVTQATAGTADVVSGLGGHLQLDCNSTTADQGIQVQRKIETFKLAANTKLVFACKFKISDGTNNFGQFFAGLSVLDTSIFAAGVVSPTDWIGFFIDAAGSAAGSLDFGLDDDVAVEEVTGVATVTDGDWFYVGFVVDGVTTATPFTMTSAGVVTLGTPITISDPPDTEMAVSFAQMSEGTDDPIATIDWYYCFQTRQEG